MPSDIDRWLTENVLAFLLVVKKMIAENKGKVSGSRDNRRVCEQKLKERESGLEKLS